MSYSNLAVGVENLVDLPTTSVSCAGALADAGASFLQNPEIAATMRTTDLNATNGKMVVDLGSDVTIDYPLLFAVIKPNWRSTATWRVVCKNAALATTYDSTTMNANQYGWWDHTIDDQWRNLAVHGRVSSTPIVVKTIEFTQTDPTNPDGFFEVSRLLVGRIVTPARGVDVGWNVTFRDPSERSEASGGNPINRRRRRRREIQAECKNATQQEALDDLIGHLDEWACITKDVLVMLYPPWAFTSNEMTSRLYRRQVYGYQQESEGVSMATWLGADNPAGSGLFDRRLSFCERT